MSTPTMQEVLINRDDLAGQLKEMRELLTRKELAFDNLEAERNSLRQALKTSFEAFYSMMHGAIYGPEQFKFFVDMCALASNDQPMRIADLDLETKRVIVAAHIYLKFRSDESLLRLDSAIKDFDAKHVKERTENLLRMLEECDEPSPTNG